MPKSKRAKIVHMSKTQKKGKELTLRLYANIQECIPKYAYIYVFSVHNMRNTYLKDVRTQLSDSRCVYPPSPFYSIHSFLTLETAWKSSLTLALHRLFFGKTKVMAVALGLTPASEPHPNTSLLSPHLHGSVGLLFSPRPPPAILAHLASFTPADYARSGTTASRTFTLPSGTLYSRGGEIPVEEDVPLAHSIEPGLRKLGVPTRLVKGRVELDGDFVVCREGEVLGSGQTTLLKMFGVTMAEFRVGVEAYWERDTGKVVVLGEDGVEKVGNEGMEVDEVEGAEGWEV